MNLHSMNEAHVFNKEQEIFIKELRHQTAESHQKLEENYLSKAILNPSVTQADYQKYLSGLYGLTIACEDQVFPKLNHIVPQLEKRYKSGKIIEDLSFTGFTDLKIDELPYYQYEFSTVAEALGIMYVLEGSSLGGRILYKHINQYLGLDAEHGAAYFWGYGQETGPMWKSFISETARFAAENREGQTIIDSAIKTFNITDTWLRK
ncbi:biliverdin-producing heme oxygenase [Dyadobacter flavalbus]|nr:biliverdin-producing heme oxygenase [Dyadobacter flavalbus]